MVARKILVKMAVKKYSFGQFSKSPRAFVIVFLLLNALVWFFMLVSLMNWFLAVLNLTYLEAIVIYAVFCLAVVGFSLAGAVLADRFQRLRIIHFWIAFGAVASLTPVLFENITVKQVTFFSLLWGASFGLGMPSCLALFAEAFPLESRGQMSGITFLITNLSAPPLILLAGSLDPNTYSLVCAAWRMLSLMVLLLIRLKDAEAIYKPPKKLSFSYVVQDRSFILYIIPWFLFCLISGLGDPVVEPVYKTTLKDFPLAVRPLIAGAFALIGGLLADKIGRKKVVIYGFISLGLAFAIVGIAPEILPAWYFFVLMNAVSAGILWAMFILTLWGDLSPKGGNEKYYAVGNMPFFVTWGVLQLVSARYLMEIPSNAVFSFASFFLFLAVLPLMYAPETLPEEKIRLRELRKYVEGAKKRVEEEREGK